MFVLFFLELLLFTLNKLTSQKAEYEKKVKQLNEDRIKHTKALEAEVKKLQGVVKESMQNFDLGLHDIYQKKLIFTATIHQEHC